MQSSIWLSMIRVKITLITLKHVQCTKKSGGKTETVQTSRHILVVIVKGLDLWTKLITKEIDFVNCALIK